MELTPKYQKPFLYSNLPVTTFSFWEDAVSAFDKKEYEQSFAATLNYINKDILNGATVQPGLTISHPHGSSEIQIEYKDGMLYFCAPFLKVPEKNKVPLLRKIAEVNFRLLTLAQIVYSNDKELLEFQYKMPMELAQPNKVYDIIKEICVYADDFDDDYIDKYGASFYHKPSNEALSDQQQEMAWDHFELYLDDAFSYIEYYEGKRWGGYVWDTITNTLLTIVDQSYLSGVLRTKIEEKLWFLRNDKESDLQRKNSVGKSFLKELKEMSKEEAQANFFLTKKFISTKSRPTEKNITGFFSELDGNIDNYIESGNYMNAFYQLKYAFLNLMFHYNLEPEKWEFLTDNLTASAETSWENGATILKKAFDQFIAGDIDTNLTANKPTKKKGFFAKLFG